MEQLQVTQFSGEDLIKKFDEIHSALEDIQKNFQPIEPLKYIGRKATSEMLDVDLSTLFNWDKRGILKPHGKIGGRVYYEISQIEQVLTKFEK